MATTPRIRVRKDGSTYSQVRYRITRPGHSKPVQSSQSFDDHAAAIRWARLLDRVGPVEAERVLAAKLAAESARRRAGELIDAADLAIDAARAAGPRPYVRAVLPPTDPSPTLPLPRAELLAEPEVDGGRPMHELDFATRDAGGWR